MSFPRSNPAPAAFHVDTQAEITGLLRDKLGVDEALPDADLIASGVLDSLTLIQLLVEIEESMEISIPLGDLDIDEVRSIASLARLVTRQRQACGVVGTASESR